MSMRSPAAARRPMIAGVAACFVYAATALASGADRMARPMLPAWLSPVAVQHAAAAALIGSEAEALPLSRQAVRSDPLNGYAVGVLGAATLLSGNAGRAAQVFAQGERLGWRDVPTRSFAFERDGRAGRWAGAGRHFQAVLRAHPDLRLAEPMLARMEGQAAGRQVLTGLLRENANWMTQHFAGPETSDAALVTRAAWLTAGRAGAIGCVSARPLVDRLLERGMRSAAGRVWQGHCDARPLPLVADAGFRDVAGGRHAGPFGWYLHPEGDLALSLDDAAESGVTVRTAASTARLILSQPTAWSAGVYSAHGKGLGQGGRFLLSLDCGRAARRPQQPTLGEHRQILRAGDCEQTLRVWVTPGEGEARLSGLAVSRP